MLRFASALILVLLIAGTAMAEDTMVNPNATGSMMKPMKVTLKGQMLCMNCDLISCAMAPDDSTKNKCVCTAIFKADDNRIYTLAPTKLGKELGDIAMHEQYVQIKAILMPGSQILDVQSYTVTNKVEPKTPESPIGWYNF